MSDELTTRLRDPNRPDADRWEDCHEAADEIERLRAYCGGVVGRQDVTVGHLKERLEAAEAEALRLREALSEALDAMQATNMRLPHAERYKNVAARLSAAMHLALAALAAHKENSDA